MTHRVTIGSWRSDGSHSHAVYLSKPIESRYPWLVFDIAGGGSGTSIQIVPGERPAEPVSLGRARAEWRQVLVRAPEGPFRIRATDDSGSGWIAFSSPRELATGGFFARWICSGGSALAVVGLFPLLAGIWVFQNRYNSGGIISQITD